MPDKRSNPAAHAIFVGAITVAVCLLLLPLPLLTGAKIGRFIVVFAVLGILLGSSICLNGLIDYWRQR